MKKGILFYSCFLLYLIFIGCKENYKNDNLIAKAQRHELAIDKQYKNLKLNNGSKWKVVDAMMVYLRTMEREINSFKPAKNTDYKALEDSLVKNVNLLTSNCTMSGDAHEQLHLWLVPYINSINELALNQNVRVKKREYHKLYNAFKVFNLYFH